MMRRTESAVFENIVVCKIRAQRGSEGGDAATFGAAF
jgi:hypothetical protein